MARWSVPLALLALPLSVLVVSEALGGRTTAAWLGWLVLVAAVLLVLVLPLWLGFRWRARQRRRGRLVSTLACLAGWTLALDATLVVVLALAIPRVPRELWRDGGWLLRFVRGTGARPGVSHQRPREAKRSSGRRPRRSEPPVAAEPLPTPYAKVAPPREPLELLRCALRGRLAVANYGGYEHLRALPECLTRRGAALSGLRLTSMTMMVPGTSVASYELRKLRGKPVEPGGKALTKEEVRARARQAKAQIKRLLAQWGLEAKTARLNPAALERLAPRGREFLRAIAALYEKLERRSAGAQRYFAKVRAKVEQRRQQYRRSPELLRRWPPYRDGAIDPSVLSAFADDYLPSARFEPQGADRQRIAWTKEPPRGFPTELIREDGVWRVVLPEKPAAPRP